MCVVWCVSVWCVVWCVVCYFFFPSLWSLPRCPSGWFLGSYKGTSPPLERLLVGGSRYYYSNPRSSGIRGFDFWHQPLAGSVRCAVLCAAENGQNRERPDCQTASAAGGCQKTMHRRARASGGGREGPFLEPWPGREAGRDGPAHWAEQTGPNTGKRRFVPTFTHSLTRSLAYPLHSQ